MVSADREPTSASPVSAINRRVDRVFDPSRNDTNWVMRLSQRYTKCLGSNGLARQADARSKKRPARRLDTRDSSRICRSRGSNCYPLQRLRPEQRFAGQRQRNDDHGRGGVQSRRNRDPVEAARRPVGIPSAVKIACSCPGRRPVSQRALKLALSLVALATSLASLFAASWVGL